MSMPYRGGLLTEAGTEVLPMECGPQCGARRACQGTRHLSRGVQLPLEVCKTKGKGWGVRCAQAIPIGKCICEYVGMLRSGERICWLCGNDPCHRDQVQGRSHSSSRVPLSNLADVLITPESLSHLVSPRRGGARRHAGPREDAGRARQH